ncbi:hypothetical protein BG61_06720 [Caballeronia glathei]|uniref:Uncharacterized protein n=1 Tax=Caballeronia glathei TaxID=60547 RepID=A0A069PKL0_9BURK|nr:hypothetical protein BG61_06720 [Caballeronia glathei]
MESPEIIYHGYVVIPLAAFEERLYASMRILRRPDGIQRASVVLGHVLCSLEARKFALRYAMAEIDHRQLLEP